MKFDNGLSTLLSNFILAVKFNWIISFLQFGMEVKKLLRFEQANFLIALPPTRMHAQATTNVRLLARYRLYSQTFSRVAKFFSSVQDANEDAFMLEGHGQ